MVLREEARVGSQGNVLGIVIAFVYPSSSPFGQAASCIHRRARNGHGRLALYAWRREIVVGAALQPHRVELDFHALQLDSLESMQGSPLRVEQTRQKLTQTYPNVCATQSPLHLSCCRLQLDVFSTSFPVCCVCKMEEAKPTRPPLFTAKLAPASLARV